MSWRIPGVHASQTYHELFRAYPFTVLHETATELVSGLCGKIWTLARDYPALARRRGVRRLGRARHRARRLRALGRPRPRTAPSCTPRPACSPVDTHARVRLKAIWTVLGPFERLVGAEPLELAVRRAEDGT